jgi:quercetin dioxygenase-like cupin family protein
MRFFFCVLFFLVVVISWGQHIPNLPSLPIEQKNNNVNVLMLATDSLCTTFLITIAEGVKHHFHYTHTENIYVIEGEGMMTLGSKEFQVSAGSYVMIPKGTIHHVIAEKPMRVLSIQTPQWVTDDRKFVDPIRRPEEKPQQE